MKQTYSGALEAKSELKYLITTLDEEFSSFIGTEQVVGKLEGRNGSFVLTHEETHNNGTAQSNFEIVPDSGTKDLKGIHGKGSFKTTHEKATFTLEYHFE